MAAGLTGETSALAISGGGADGAFGVGVLRGWTETGTRPEFVTVTGVSTGALTAPFAFLGPEYDDTLATLYGGLAPDSYFEMRSIFSILPNVSVTSSAPLFELIIEYADEEMLRNVAREHKRGRRLFVQTTNLDAQRAVVWDLGAIASSGAPNALDVFRKALLASASIPIAFPPVIFEVEVDGKRYDEMHVDGGVIAQSTTLASWQYNIAKERASRGASTGAPDKLYLIRNGRLDPDPKALDYSMLDIAGQAVSTMIKVSGFTDVIVAYETAKFLGADFLVTWMGQDFTQKSPEPFDANYMKALQQYCYDLMVSGQVWETKPEMYMSDEERRLSPRMGGIRSDTSAQGGASSTPETTTG